MCPRNSFGDAHCRVEETSFVGGPKGLPDLGSLKQWNPREWSEATKPWEKERPGCRGIQPTRAGWYGGIFNENVEQDQEQNNERADHNDANEERRADAGNEEQGDEHEAGAPPPNKSVDLTAAKSEVELLTAQLAQQGSMLAQQRALFHQLQQGAATSAPNSASGSMMGLNAELASHENAQGGSDATTDPAATEPAPGTNYQYHHQGSPMHPPNPFPYAPHPGHNQFGAYGFPYHGFPPPFPPGFHPHGFMGHPNMMMPTPHAVPRDDPYDINSPLICRQATRVTKVYTERMLQAGTVSVGLLLVWIRSFRAW